METDGEIGAGTAEPNPIEPVRGEVGRALLEQVRVRTPGGDGILGVEPERVRDLRPQPLHVRLAEDRPGPPLRRPRRGRPGERVRLHPTEETGDHPRVERLRSATRVGIRHELRVRLPSEADQGVGLVEALDDPRRRPGELLEGSLVDRDPP